MQSGRHIRHDVVNGAKKIKLAVFDLDGTLTRSGTSVLRHVGQELGFAAKAERLAALYSDRTLTNAQVVAHRRGVTTGPSPG
jgi:phosphoglycolate phosphatase-like HAD superfamily hydrolase